MTSIFDRSLNINGVNSFSPSLTIPNDDSVLNVAEFFDNIFSFEVGCVNSSVLAPASFPMSDSEFNNGILPARKWYDHCFLKSEHLIDY